MPVPEINAQFTALFLRTIGLPGPVMLTYVALAWRQGSASAAGTNVMRLRSSAFADGAAIPRRFTCEGENVSPPLEWSDVPPGIKSFAVICEDPDAPGGTFHHWAAYDIAATQSGLPLDASHQAQRLGFQQATNDFERTGYSGPCPPGGTPHHYHFRLLALSVEQLSVPENSSRLPENPSCREVEREARKHVLAEATLVGIYRR